jgi:hypothetical protein
MADANKYEEASLADNFKEGSYDGNADNSCIVVEDDTATLLRRKQDAEDEEKKCVSEEDEYTNHDSNLSSRRIEPRSVVGTSIVKGTIVYIPYGKMLIVPSDTIHGGGFKRGVSGNLRFHLYIAGAMTRIMTKTMASEERRIELLQHTMKKYTERYDRTRELCERFVDSNGMDGLLGHFFDD